MTLREIKDRDTCWRGRARVTNANQAAHDRRYLLHTVEKLQGEIARLERHIEALESQLSEGPAIVGGR